MFTSLQCLLENKPIITTLVALENEHSEIVADLDWNLVQSLFEVLRLIVSKLNIFEQSKRTMAYSIQVYIDLLAETLEEIILCNAK